MNNKQYTWAPDAEIKFTGQQFGAVLNGLRFFMESPSISPSTIMVIGEINQLFNQKFNSLVEAGVAKIAEPETKEKEDDVIEVEAIPE